MFYLKKIGFILKTIGFLIEKGGLCCQTTDFFVAFFNTILRNTLNLQIKCFGFFTKPVLFALCFTIHIDFIAL